MRRQLIKVIIQEIKISLGKKKEKGDIEIHFRGDGRIKKEWVNKIANPDKLVSSYYRTWLRETFQSAHCFNYQFAYNY